MSKAITEAAIRKAGQVAIDELIERMDGVHPGNDDLADYLTRIVDACVRPALSAPLPEVEGGDKGDGWEDSPQSPWPASDWAIERIAKLEEALGDLMTWFPEKPSEPEWRIKAGDYGADEAVSAARAALAAAPSASIEGETP